MRWYSGTMLAIGIAALAASAALAAENYVARGHSYAPGEESLPPLNSEADVIDRETDLYEADLNRRQREQKLFETRMNRFTFELEPDAIDNAPEY